ncbi:hypothetical protein RJ55_05879 [Drechmeria coniospora]|nr:hypothetical protein RJ55_05879 [Drechmeria coniospora]
MAGGNLGAGPKIPPPASPEAAEDAKTRATRRELKQSSISDQQSPNSVGSACGSPTEETASARVGDVSGSQTDASAERPSSPKKKRARDELDCPQAFDAEGNGMAGVDLTDVAKNRSLRLEPEKKRARDEVSSESATDPPSEANADIGKAADAAEPELETTTATGAFTTSGFAKLATGASAFASIGASKVSGFGSTATEAPSSFAPPKPSSTSRGATVGGSAPKLSFGGSATASPFANLSSPSNGFGNGVGRGFGSALLGTKPLTSFGAAGGKPLQSGKASKPFGAPDSESDDDDDEDGEYQAEGQDDNGNRAATPDKEAEDKRKPKLHKVDVDDGEAGEITLVSVRAKMFSLDKEVGWKERGGGMLKINVPRICVNFDDQGAAMPGSFDVSSLETDDNDLGDDAKGHKVARLIMRQDQTHRVILNTAVVAAMQFQEKASLKAVGILFTAFEGEKATPTSVTMKMSAASAKSFMKEIGMIQQELRRN